MARVPFVLMGSRVFGREEKDIFNQASKWTWLVLALIFPGLLTSLVSAAGSDSADTAVATDRKVSIIPEPVTLLVLLAGLMLFGWKRNRKSRSHSAAPATWQ